MLIDSLAEQHWLMPPRYGLIKQVVKYLNMLTLSMTERLWLVPSTYGLSKQVRKHQTRWEMNIEESPCFHVTRPQFLVVSKRPAVLPRSALGPSLPLYHFRYRQRSLSANSPQHE